MALDATTRRRWFGALVLLAALGMLIGGETVLKEKLANLAFIIYWLVCFGFTGVAIVIAFLDARALQRRTHQEQHDLFESTLKRIETEAKARPRRPDQRQGRS
jgi:membrane protein implicated in regulation of membrane protease activity